MNETESTALRERVRWLEQRLAETLALQHQIHASWSWRLTHPVRELGRLYRALRRRLPTLPGRGRNPAAVHANPTDLKQAYRQRLQAELACWLASGHGLHFTPHTTPQVSIILVLYNQAELTLACLRSLVGLDVPYELLIWDNASSDATSALLARLSGVRIWQHDKNLNFLQAVNQVWPQARGEYVLLLNNDTQLLPGALEQLTATLAAYPQAGGVGGKILLLDGRLQEAGSMVWQDGTCLGYGRGQDPCAPEYQFRRTVDYVSGAFLLLRRALTTRLGVFDPDYAPAYYEETDLCLRLRAAGHPILYEPAATLVHFEFGSSSHSAAAFALQQRNQVKFQAKHAATLQRQHLPPAPQDPAVVLQARFAWRTQQRVLVLDDRLPDPSLGAGFPRAQHLLHTLHQLGVQVTFYPVKVPQAMWTEVYRLLPREIEVILDAGEAGLAAFLAQRRGYFHKIIVSRPHNMALLQTLVPQPLDIPIIYDAEALFAQREQTRQQHFQGKISPSARAAEQAELALVRHAQAVLAVNPAEAALYQQATAAPVYVLGHALTPQPTPARWQARLGLLFVGAVHHPDTPNADSLRWLLQEILPLVVAQLGEIPVTLVGHQADVSLAQRAPAYVQFTGRVAELAPYFNAARLFLAPTRYAAGVPHKAHEAAAYGLPLVTTTLLARQLGWTSGQELLSADTTESYAAAVVRAYQDATLWTHLRTQALARVTADCDPARFTQVLSEVLALPNGKR